MNILSSLLLILTPSFSWSQSLPVGLFEGLMANSGVATQSSSAASYYNPSLLSQRSQSAYNLGGNGLGSSTSENSDASVSSTLQISPTYLSSILAGSTVVQEIFIATAASGQFDIQMKGQEFNSNGKMNFNQVISGYSLAFRNFPLAFQVLARYSDANLYTFSEGPLPNSNNPNAYVVGKSESDFKNLNLALGLSTILNFGSYSLGFNWHSRGVNLLDKNEGYTKTYIHGYPNPQDLTVSGQNRRSLQMSNTEGKLAVGHGFKLGRHEFLTDSVFYESSGNLDRYKIFQTFGYRFGLGSEDQFLCGISHEIGPEIQYFGQNINSSVGYSWTTRKLRTSAGLFFSKSDTKETFFSYGLVFGSQYEY